MANEAQVVPRIDDTVRSSHQSPRRNTVSTTHTSGPTQKSAAITVCGTNPIPAWRPQPLPNDMPDSPNRELVPAF